MRIYSVIIKKVTQKLSDLKILEFCTLEILIKDFSE